MKQSSFSIEDLITLLNAEQEEMQLLFDTAGTIKKQVVGNKVYFRGLIELSNCCRKDCLYCGIRKSNTEIHRYELSDQEILDAAAFAHEHLFGSIVLQSGEITTPAFVRRIEKLLHRIKELSHGELGITLSMGEQNPDVYRRWFEAGAHRYLLRIETTNEELFRRIHPLDSVHDFKRRLDCLSSLKEIGYQTGTGVMIGLPFQRVEDLAKDLLFFRDFDVDMVGMGPYLEHSQTPLYRFRNLLLPVQYRFNLSLKMIAALRILMKDINIAAATALQAIDPIGREKAVKVGANVIMPNITPGLYRNYYKLYENKPCLDEEPNQCLGCLDVKLALTENEIGYDEWGDSKHFFEKKSFQTNPPAAE
jgi:biotin synthase